MYKLETTINRLTELQRMKNPKKRPSFMDIALEFFQLDDYEYLINLGENN
jgi:hypothetical protein